MSTKEAVTISAVNGAKERLDRCYAAFVQFPSAGRWNDLQQAMDHYQSLVRG